MFALPGIACLIVFMYLRPQEYYTILQRAPLLYIFFAAAVGGLAIDFKLRLIKPLPTRTLLFAAVFFTWLIINNLIKVPGGAIGNIIEFTIVFVAYVSLSHAVQSFHAFRLMAGVVVFIGLFLTIVGVHQANADHGCLRLAVEGHKGVGLPDGRPCQTVMECLGVDAEPGAAYDCQRVGLFGTTALDDRVRYRGELQDPNELSLVVVGTFALLIGFAIRKRTVGSIVIAGAGGLLIFQCIIYTQSRGGILIFLAVVGAYFIQKFGAKYALIGMMAMMPVLSLGGRSGAAADESTRGRYEAWRAGLQMLRMDPVFGVGHRQFTQYHHLTAHNSYVLSFAELGIFGMMLWVSVLYMTIKVPLTAVRDFANDPRAGPARDWGMALLGMSAAHCIQMLFLSLTYHTMTWVFFGLSGAFYSAVKRHRPDWHVPFGPLDAAGIAIGCIVFIAVLPFFLAYKGV